MLPSRIDYVKFLFVCDSDEMQRKYEHLQSVLTGGDTELMGKMKFTALGYASTVGAGRRYVVEAWGNTAANAEYLPAHYIQNLTRLDVKSDGLCWDDHDVENLAARWVQHDNRRNVQTFRSRPRSKKSGRSAGGRGVALGSHKSDLRITVYRRPTGLYQLEAQVSGRLLKKLIDEAKHEAAMTKDPNGLGVWDFLTENCLGTGIDRVIKSANLEGHTLPAAVPPGETPADTFWNAPKMVVGHQDEDGDEDDDE